MTTVKSEFLAIPLDNIQLVDMAEGEKFLSGVRPPRHASPSGFHKKGGYLLQGAPEAQASSQFKRNDFNPNNYVDYGAHTGHHGAFGWYVDFPVQKDS